MLKIFFVVFLVLPFPVLRSPAQSIDSLCQKIRQIISAKNADVGVAIIGNNGKETLSINGDRHFPMQSVFKLHIALALLSEIDERKFSFDQKINVEPKDLLSNLYSPIREKYPKGGVLTVAQVLEYTISQSDNVGCNLLLKLMGGPQVVEDYFIKNNLKDVSIKFDEEKMQSDWEAQFQNWTTPASANEVLTTFYFNAQKLLSEKSHDFIWKIMRETQTGQNRLKGLLPKGTVAAHKTGTSGTNPAGITAAVNDIGVVFLPNGQPVFISVFVTNSKENKTANEQLIADIAKAAWDYFLKKKN